LLEIIEIIRQLEQGITKPYLCLANNDEKYIIKGNTALGRGRICEYICAHIGKAFKLPIPDFDLIEIPNELLISNKLKQDLGGQPVFASKYIPFFQEFDHKIMNKVSINLLMDIFLFDYWIHNEDRILGSNDLGNPNLIYSTEKKELYVIDHNLAFDEDYNFKNIRKYHACRNSWFKPQCSLTNFNYEQQIKYKKRMCTALKYLEQYFNNIPKTWLSCSSVEDDFIDKIRHQLKSYKTPIFWERLQ